LGFVAGRYHVIAEVYFVFVKNILADFVRDDASDYPIAQIFRDDTDSFDMIAYCEFRHVVRPAEE